MIGRVGSRGGGQGGSLMMRVRAQTPWLPGKTRMAPGRARGYTAWEKTSQGFRGGARFMADGSKRVFFVNGPAHPIFTEIVEKRADIRLDKLKNDSPDDLATPVLAGAHGYQIGSARDELAKKYHAGPDLLRRTQSLLIVSTNGAGYDTVNLKACTEAGVLCLNQAGGNKEAVAEHALAMMLSLSKRIVEADRAIRREIIDRNIFMGHDLLGQTVGNVGKRLGELCRGLFRMRVLSYDPYVSADMMKTHGVEKVDLDTLMRESD